MDIKELIYKIKSENENISQKYNELIRSIDESIDIKNNDELKKQLEEYKKDNDLLKSRLRNLNSENESLKISLREQILDEKLNILKISRRKLATYFNKIEKDGADSLSNLENALKNRISSIKGIVERELSSEREVFLAKIAELDSMVADRLRSKREEFHSESLKAAEEFKAGYSRLDNREVDEETVKERIKQNKFEMKIGLNLLNKLGIILVVIGLCFFVSYNWTHINVFVKGGASFLIGIIALIGGEILYRRKKDVFSHGLLGGGVAVLYASVFYSYFLLKIIGMNSALVLSVVITLITIVLALRYNSRTIITLGLIGGFLPFISYAFTSGFSGNGYYYGMGYLFIINLLVLVISFSKKWTVLNYVSFVLNIPALCYLVFNCGSLTAGLIYTIATSVVYIVLVVLYPVLHKKGITIPDLILLGLNTTASALIIYILFEKNDITYLRGSISLSYCLLYAGLGYLFSIKLKEELKSIALFFLTAVTFSLLMIPFQFGVVWISTGWLIESVLLIVYGYIRRIKPIEITGFVILGLCLFVFYSFDVLPALYVNEVPALFNLKYFIVTLGLVVIGVVYQVSIFKSTLVNLVNRFNLIKFIKYFVLANLYVFSIYISLYYYDFLVKNLIPFNYYQFFKMMILAVINFIFSLLLVYKYVTDKVLKFINTIFVIYTDLLCLYIILTVPLGRGDTSGVLSVISIVILIVYSILVLINLRGLAVKFTKSFSINLEYYPVFVGMLLLLYITSFLLSQFYIANISVIISFIYLFIAILSIIWGFVRRYTYIRYFGLALTVISLAKFFVYDLWNLDIVIKIVSYLVFGVILIMISFVYQVINNKLKSVNKEKESDEISG